MKDPHSSSEQTDVVILGAGPTGLVLACELARRGINFKLIDKAEEAFKGSRGKGIQPRTIEIFDDLGIAPDLLAEGGAYPKMNAHVSFLRLKWSMIKRGQASPDIPYPSTWLVPQWRTETVLRRRLADFGYSVEYGSEAVAIRQDGTAVTVELRRGGSIHTIRARYAVGADGGRSFVRKALAVEFIGTTSEEGRMIVGDLQVDGLTRDYWHVWPMAKGGLVGLCPLPHSNLFQLMMTIDPSDQDPELTDRGVQNRWLAATGLKKIRLHSPTWLSVFRPNIRLVDRYRVGRIFLAGDAAHVHTPAGAQGLNTGIQDAYNLGWKLALVLGGASDSLLDTYQEERMPVAANVLEISTKLYQAVHRKSLPNAIRGDKERQLLLSYRTSSLASETGSSTSRILRAGDRAPDAPCLNQSQHRTRLFDVFRGPHFTLLAFGMLAIEACRALATSGVDLVRVVAVTKAAQGPENGDSLVDDRGFISKAYGVGAEDNIAILIRPDGYVGHIAHDSWARSIANYFANAIGINAYPNLLYGKQAAVNA